jgi:anti-anti-sigma factor
MSLSNNPLRSTFLLNHDEPTAPFEVTLLPERAGVVRAVLSGDLDYLSVPALNEALKETLADPALRELILDLDNITYLSGAGLGAMVALRHALHDRGGELFLNRCQGQVLRILQVTRLVYFFKVLPE